jgi:hypothetical protein
VNEKKLLIEVFINHQLIKINLPFEDRYWPFSATKTVLDDRETIWPQAALLNTIRVTVRRTWLIRAGP